jgi:molecular chaperone GrpE
MKNKKEMFEDSDDDFIVSDKKKEDNDGDAVFEINGSTQESMARTGEDAEEHVIFETRDIKPEKNIEEVMKAEKESPKMQEETEDVTFDISDSSADVKTAAAEKNAKQGTEDSADRKKIEELAGQLAAANDKYLRLMAEFDNFKRRSAKEYERLIEAANERLMKDLTEVRENFERAIKSNASGENLQEGMKLIFSKLNTILEKHGLEIYAEAGQQFDPEIHDALMSMHHESIEKDHIVEVHERGYKLKGGILKHAKVVVSKGKPEAKPDEETVIEIK